MYKATLRKAQAQVKYILFNVRQMQKIEIPGQLVRLPGKCKIDTWHCQLKQGDSLKHDTSSSLWLARVIQSKHTHLAFCYINTFQHHFRAQRKVNTGIAGQHHIACHAYIASRELFIQFILAMSTFCVWIWAREKSKQVVNEPQNAIWKIEES